ncbi:Stk1 family PASTA domain-containing Ser/Thr kinase [Cellulomonas dongxiuzhuiae]|uniref:non-specific serine/threonine protein kinase n=1 Tax=Cellulomonas dongxiuzhuiae TaxID=2819979 RepID=A0ABX8GGN3_9CELL|nr:Stk1 family PASTA domain-containing Ser/Thr kinase [Cellulomonas dongxiuzhuiae]MBO3093674.1 Stk1 family PASTA domain-containing Ser/Thr kinase [Cellulomonas dongxiuzhuiae]QWC14786.1 Stk1 family PASTA domain-containing Ser/Thr kinase [Cellulomonas dongxiuzhuiae]
MGTTVTDPLVGRLVDGRYEVVSRIARGGMATVYLAIDRRLDREVALKVMHPHLAEGATGGAFVARFRREARSAARLTHPGLVGVFDQGVDGETSYLTMEYVDGSNLRRQIAEQGALRVGEALRVTESVLDALAAAHRAGLVHRDVKPENVLIASDDRVRVADFGLARAVTEVTSTTTGTVLGTVAYLAPELVQRGASDARTDVYATGVMLFEMLTGRQPFTGETAIQVAFQHVTSEIPAPSTLVDWLPSEVDELVGALAAHSPEDRPLDAGAALLLVRRTRLALDDVTLDRRAEVPPTVVLPAATDLDETDLPFVGDAEDDLADDPGLTARVPVGDHARGGTVALPIGLGVVEPAGTTAPPASRRRRTVIAVTVAVLALLGLGTWWYLEAGPGAYTSVPAVLEVPEDDAVAALEDAGLRHTRAEAFDDTVAAGSVLSTDPGPGAAVRKDGTVTYTVSKGPDLVVVPDGLVGAMQADAEGALEGAELVAAYGDEEYHDEAPAGQVLTAALPDGTAADAGAQVKRGSAVTLVLSRGPAPVTVTSVVGITVEDAQEQLASDALTVEATEAFHDTVPAGRIIDQSPVAGETAHRGDVVTVTVSKGPETVPMPDLTGKQFDKAKAELDSLGLTAKRENVLGGFFGTVRTQSVPAGESVRKGTEIVLQVV